MSKRISFIVVALATIAGCSTNVGEEASSAANENLGTTSQAITVIDHCAEGNTANAWGNLFNENDTDSYTRLWQYIENICPQPSRGTTYVDFHLGAGAAAYQFDLHESFWTATNPTQCAGLRSALRVMRWHNSAWETLEFREVHGTWTFNPSEPNFGHCTVPGNYITEVSLGGGEWFRVRANARQWDDSFATVTIKGTNKGM